jgi:flagellar basal-body rod protein FlgB
MSLIDTAQISALTRFLDATVQRHQAITNNIANIDTPGFKTKDIDFRSALNAAGEGMMPASLQPNVREVQGLMERPDGNNVSLEREGLALADTQLQFQAGVQLLRSEFRRIQMAINEGR